MRDLDTTRATPRDPAFTRETVAASPAERRCLDCTAAAHPGWVRCVRCDEALSRWMLGVLGRETGRRS